MPPTHTWKSKERQIALWFGTVRRALSGGNSNPDELRDDAHHKSLFIETKYRKSHAVWALWRFAKACCAREIRLPKRRPVVALYECRQEGALLVIHQDDLLAVALARLDTLTESRSSSDAVRDVTHDAASWLRKVVRITS